MLFLEAQERNIVVRRSEIMSFIRSLGFNAASTSSEVHLPKVSIAPDEAPGVSSGVPAPASTVVVASSSVSPPALSGVPTPAQLIDATP